MSDRNFHTTLLASHKGSEIPGVVNPNFGAARLRQKAAKTSHYTVTEDDDLIDVNATGGAVTITLLDAALAYDSVLGGHVFEIVKNDASGNAVTVAAPSGNLINGASTVTLSSQYSACRVQSLGAGVWRRVIL
jgi:hypothetical protein